MGYKSFLRTDEWASKSNTPLVPGHSSGRMLMDKEPPSIDLESVETCHELQVQTSLIEHHPNSLRIHFCKSSCGGSTRRMQCRKDTQWWSRARVGAPYRALPCDQSALQNPNSSHRVLRLSNPEYQDLAHWGLGDFDSLSDRWSHGHRAQGRLQHRD